MSQMDIFFVHNFQGRLRCLAVWLIPPDCSGESSLWMDSQSLWGDKALKRALSHPHCFLIHPAPTKPPNPILAFLQLASPANEYEHVCLHACVVFLSSGRY